MCRKLNIFVHVHFLWSKEKNVNKYKISIYWHIYFIDKIKNKNVVVKNQYILSEPCYIFLLFILFVILKNAVLEVFFSQNMYNLAI